MLDCSRKSYTEGLFFNEPPLLFPWQFSQDWSMLSLCSRNMFMTLLRYTSILEVQLKKHECRKLLEEIFPSSAVSITASCLTWFFFAIFRHNSQGHAFAATVTFSPVYLSPFSSGAACPGPAGCLLTDSLWVPTNYISRHTEHPWEDLCTGKSCHQHIKHTQRYNNLIMM